MALVGDGGEGIWETTEALAWNRQLQAEHRLWILLAIGSIQMVALAWFSRGRWVNAGLAHAQFGVAVIQPPLTCERLFVCLAPSFNMPQEIDDLRESYGDMVAEHGREMANRWYAAQLGRSLRHYFRQWGRRIPPRRSS